MAAEQQKYAADIKKLNDQLASLTQSTADNNRKFSSDVQKEQEERKKLASVINVQKTTIEKQSDIISTLTRTDFEIPDGRITSVNGATKIVWLNLGYLDALPNQIKFNVYDSQAAAFDENAKKGEIKIQRIVGPHTAEAIIIEKGQFESKFFQMILFSHQLGPRDNAPSITWQANSTWMVTANQIRSE